MSMMGSDGDLGVILFSSRDPHHYQPGQGRSFTGDRADAAGTAGTLD